MSEAPPSMTSHRPYLLRALYEWISDNGMTPHLLVDAERSGVRVPAQAVKDGKIVLNVADRAVARLEMGNDEISFSARFGGVSESVVVPVGAVLAIYARETGQGMALPEDIETTSDDSSETGSTRPPLSAVPDQPDDGAGDDGGPDDDGPGSPGPRRGGHLRVVK